MASTIIVALVLIGFIALVVGILMFVHNRDKKADQKKMRVNPTNETIDGW
jgi:uncharacterized membrane protein HdeD (DUF308 family)